MLIEKNSLCSSKCLSLFHSNSLKVNTEVFVEPTNKRFVTYTVRKFNELYE